MAISQIALIAGFLALLAGIIILIIGIRLFILYKEKRSIPGLFLCLSVFSWVGAAFSVMEIYFFAGENLDISIIFQKLVYLFVFLATMLTFLFGSKIFFTMKKPFMIGYLIIGITAIIVILVTDSVDVNSFPDGSGHPLLSLSVDYGFLMVLYILPTTLSIAIVALRLSKKVEDIAYKQGFKIIAYGQLMLILTFVVDTLASLFLDKIGLYSLFLYLTWIFPIFAAICYDTGWRIPQKASKNKAA